MTLNTFYANNGPLAWSVFKSPNWATRMQRAVSGREYRVNDFTFPIWNYTLTYEVLRDVWDYRQGPWGSGPGFPGYDSNGNLLPGFQELEYIVSFFNQQRGAAIPFQWEDPSDNDTSIYNVTADSGDASSVVIGVGDGVTTQFRIVGRQLGPAIPTLIRYVNPNTGYSIDFDNALLHFGSPPAAGQIIQIGMHYNQRVRFKNDNFEAEEFMYQLWQLKKLELQSVIW